jgi:REP element-mobilizing transposase RayT
MKPPLAYHLTWTCYGQWLHGDTRGYVDDEHRTPGTPYVHNDPQLYNASFNRMAEPPCWLTDEQRAIADAALREACEFRRWPLKAVNVQPDHVHLIVQVFDKTGKDVMSRLKGRATQCLNEKAMRRTWWTEGGKVELVHDERQLAIVIEYVNDQRFPKVGE